jgi:hypothetical protein
MHSAVLGTLSSIPTKSVAGGLFDDLLDGLLSKVEAAGTLSSPFRKLHRAREARLRPPTEVATLEKAMMNYKPT